MSSLDKNIHTVKCSTEGCNKPVKARGLCRRHYVSPAMLKTCATDGCNNNVSSKGVCIKHYINPARLEACGIDGCRNNAVAKGVCQKHYVRPITLGLCNIEGCNNSAYGKGACSKHYVRPSQLEACSVDGCDDNVHASGICTKHRLRAYRKGTTEPPELNKQTTHGYIIHNHAGTPVYVGITCNFQSRMDLHEHTQPWGPYVNIPEQPTVTFDNREQASEWEQQTIAKLAQTTPLFNDTYNPNWSLDYEHDLLERTIDIHNQHTLLQSVVESHT